MVVASMTAVAIPGTMAQADSRTHGVIVATTTAIGGLIGSLGGPIGAAAGGVAGAAAGEYGKKINSVLTSPKAVAFTKCNLAPGHPKFLPCP